MRKIKLKSNKIITVDTSVKELITILLKNRQILSKDAREFLFPPYPQPSLAGLIRAVARIKKAIRNKENILVYGDYDVDGLTATAILWQVLNKLGAQVWPFIPHRQLDGYGFKAQSFYRFQQEKGVKFNLVITVDNGIVAGREFKKLKDVEVIVADHHLPDDKLPEVYSIIHSTKLSGSGLAWVLASNLDKKADLGLAALGTVADCLPLTGVNRQIVVHGLKKLSTDPCPGLKQLLSVSAVRKAEISAYELGFVLGPRLNAVGRLADPTDGLRLLCSRSENQAAKYAAILDGRNLERRDLEKEGITRAEQLIDCQQNILVAVDKSFLPGVIGLIAGRLTEKYYLPTIIIAEDKDISKASCRSIPEINIIKLLRNFTDLLLDLGGHAQAAGFSILTKNIPKFIHQIEKYPLKKFNRPIQAEARMLLSAVNMRNIRAIERLAPFGLGNPKPVFLFEKAVITGKRMLGSDHNHLKLILNDSVKAIAFRRKDLDSALNMGDIINLTASVETDDYGGTASPQLIIKEIFKSNDGGSFKK